MLSVRKKDRTGIKRGSLDNVAAVDYTTKWICINIIIRDVHPSVCHASEHAQ